MRNNNFGIETKVEFEGHVFSLTVGYKTQWFEQVPKIMLVKEEYDEHKHVIWATVLWESDI